MSEVAEYICKRKCHIPIVMTNKESGHPQVVQKMFEIDEPYNVGQGELVPHHFRPANKVAQSDREEQITEPERFIETSYDMGMIAEFMVDAGFYEDDMHYVESTGKTIVRKSAKKIAEESIKETLGDNVYRALLNGEQHAKEFKKRDEAIEEMCALGKDDKETRKALLAILKEGNVTKGFFRGAPVQKLAGFIYDKGLYKG